MKVREIQGFLAEMYAMEASLDLIRRPTEEVMGEVTAWQTCSLKEITPVVVFNARPV